MPEIKQITAAGNLAFPIRWIEEKVEEEVDGEKVSKIIVKPTIWAYHAPVPLDVFEANYSIISTAHERIFMHDNDEKKAIKYALDSGPLIATLELKKAARAEAIENEEPDPDPAGALLAEIKRRTTILAPTPEGYKNVPIDVALSTKIIDAEDWREAESSIVFFTCGSWMTRRRRKETRSSALALALRGSVTSSPPMEFVASLATSTTAGTSAAVAPSSIPS